MILISSFVLSVISAFVLSEIAFTIMPYAVIAILIGGYALTAYLTDYDWWLH
jgi:hypothetical protein